MTKPNDRASDFSIVYIIDESCFGTVVSHGAFASKINYMKDGIEYEIDLPNEDFYVVDEIGIQQMEEDL